MNASSSLHAADMTPLLTGTAVLLKVVVDLTDYCGLVNVDGRRDLQRAVRAERSLRRTDSETTVEGARRGCTPDAPVSRGNATGNVQRDLGASTVTTGRTGTGRAPGRLR